MNPRTRFRIALVVLGLGVLVFVASRRADAQSSIYTNVRVVNPVLVGSDGGFTAIVSGTMSLSQQTLNSLVAPQVQTLYPAAKLTLDAGVMYPIPPFLADGGLGGDPARTSLTISVTSTGAGKTMSCDVLAPDGGFPSCAAGSGFGELMPTVNRVFTWSVGQSRVVYCLPCNVAGIEMSYREEVFQ